MRDALLGDRIPSIVSTTLVDGLESMSWDLLGARPKVSRSPAWDGKSSLALDKICPNRDLPWSVV